MIETDARAALERLIRERGEDYAGLSRLIGRNAAYVQQFVRRGTPRILAEADRRTLARYFGVSEAVLGGPAERRTADHVVVPRLEVEASAGPGVAAGVEARTGTVAFDPAWLRRLGVTGAERLSWITVRGDSMAPTLGDGDELLVDGGDGAGRLRDGIYVLRADDALLVKRVAVDHGRRRVHVRSDNPAYLGWEAAIGDLAVIGRVVWMGRRVA